MQQQGEASKRPVFEGIRGSPCFNEILAVLINDSRPTRWRTPKWVSVKRFFYLLSRSTWSGCHLTKFPATADAIDVVTQASTEWKGGLFTSEGFYDSGWKEQTGRDRGQMVCT
ncbi:hypothetical protein GOP47_0005493 [Adiantum capillus-veneris]|uniref:Uncharacterized protein n=1 Tax=Adiantum capillus-veneris TaxID=13818 RepID=A0A9D4V5N0_ADICA|nr:hypothetical protein GOP47_0005493 [Adiantum capillus-veneris]